MSEKTEPPSPKKIRDAREQGNLLKSTEVVTTAALLGGILSLPMIAAEIPGRFVQAMVDAVRLGQSGDFGVAFSTFGAIMVSHVFQVVIICFGAVVGVAVIANVAQIGVYFSASKFGKGFDSLNPINNAKNLFSKKTLTTFLINLVKVLIILGVSIWIYGEEKALATKVYSCQKDVVCGLKVGAEMVYRLMMYATVAMVPIAVIDWIVQRYFYMKDLMMSIEDVKREYKESEGDPELKGHRKQMAHEIVHSDSAGKAAKASVVVRNPTHVAVGLRFAPEEAPLPYVVCKGTGALAERIIAEAERNGIPTYEDVPLARGLHEACNEYDFVPRELVEPVAKLVRWLYVNYPDRVYEGNNP
jgi:type III secretion protein U